MVRVIINADDFGLSPCINEGIVKAHRQGVLTSATLMANTPGFSQAVELSRDNPKLGVGIHLNIVRGLPVSAAVKIPSLVGPDGRFYSSASVVLRKLVAGRIKQDDVEREFRAQVEKVLAAGVVVSHLDSEKNLHVLPPLLRAAIRVAEDCGIKKMRCVREYRLSLGLGQSLKAALLSLSGASAARRLQRAGMVITDRFYGISSSGRMTAARIRKILERQTEGSAEIMVHPGFIREELRELEQTVGRYYINACRELELEALLDPGLRETVGRRGIQLINYHEL